MCPLFVLIAFNYFLLKQTSDYDCEFLKDLFNSMKFETLAGMYANTYIHFGNKNINLAH